MLKPTEALSSFSVTVTVVGPVETEAVFVPEKLHEAKITEIIARAAHDEIFLKIFCLPHELLKNRETGDQGSCFLSGNIMCIAVTLCA